MSQAGFPINIFGYALRGLKTIFKFLSGGRRALYGEKLEGDSLEEELKRVKKESNDFQRNQVEIEKREVLSNKKLNQYNYLVRNSNGEKLKGSFDAETKDDVRIFLVNNGYEIISIEPKKKYEMDINIGSGKISKGDLSFMLTQLSTYIKSGIPLIDSVKILTKQTKKQAHRKVLDQVTFSLMSGENFSSALEKQGSVFPQLLINMVKTAEMTGDLAGTLDEMSEYYTETEKARKQMISALIYPVVILTLAIGALVFVMIFVVPNFVNIFEQNGGKDRIPKITKFVIALSDFMDNNWMYLLGGLIAVIVTIVLLYKNIKSARKMMQMLLMRMPVIGNIIIYNEVGNLTRTFASLLNHNVFITDSMEILSKISSNEIYKDIINRTLIGLSKGERISESFRGEWAFPVVAYEMLVTGENTGQLNVMMEKVAKHYTELHKNAVGTIKSLIEPIIIIVLAGGVGFIVLSIVIPMFSMYDTMSQIT